MRKSTVPPPSPVGFDYARAILAIRRRMTYEEIAGACGYDSANGVYKVIKGSIPDHPHGEAIYVLYREIFGSKPPMSVEQETGAIANSASAK